MKKRLIQIAYLFGIAVIIGSIYSLSVFKLFTGTWFTNFKSSDSVDITLLSATLATSLFVFRYEKKNLVRWTMGFGFALASFVMATTILATHLATVFPYNTVQKVFIFNGFFSFTGHVLLAVGYLYAVQHQFKNKKDN